MVHLAAVQQERWIHFVESTDLTQNSRKAWHNIRKISNDPIKPNSQYEVTANQVAHVLIKNDKTQVMKKQSKIEIPYSKYNTANTNLYCQKNLPYINWMKQLKPL